MQRIIIAVLALALIVPIGAIGVFGGFGQNEPSAAPSTGEGVPGASALPSADPASQPKPSPTTAPAEPASVRQQNAAGAEATMRYLLEYYPYMMATGDTKGWKDSVSPDCRICTTFIAQSEKLHAEGGYIVGGAFTLKEMQFAGKGTPPTGGVVTVPFSEAEQTIIVDVHKQAQKQPAITGTMRGTMSWNGKRWVVADLALDKPAAG